MTGRGLLKILHEMFIRFCIKRNNFVPIRFQVLMCGFLACWQESESRCLASAGSSSLVVDSAQTSSRAVFSQRRGSASLPEDRPWRMAFSPPHSSRFLILERKITVIGVTLQREPVALAVEIASGSPGASDSGDGNDPGAPPTLGATLLGGAVVALPLLSAVQASTYSAARGALYCICFERTQAARGPKSFPLASAELSWGLISKAKEYNPAFCGGESKLRRRL